LIIFHGVPGYFRGGRSFFCGGPTPKTGPFYKVSGLPPPPKRRTDGRVLGSNNQTGVRSRPANFSIYLLPPGKPGLKKNVGPGPTKKKNRAYGLLSSLHPPGGPPGRLYIGGPIFKGEGNSGVEGTGVGRGRFPGRGQAGRAGRRPPHSQLFKTETVKV